MTFTAAAACAARVAAAGTEAASAPSLAASQQALVVYRGATLFDGTDHAPRPDMDVVVDGERIVQVTPDASLDADLLRVAKVVDLRGRFLTPGLVDAHVHLATPPNRRQAEAVLRRDLYGGVTTVRDMADDLRAVSELARASLVGEIAAPDIHSAALMAGPGFFTDPRTAQTSAGGTPGQVPWMQAVTDETDLPLAVAEARGSFATAIKLYADLTPALAARITAEAHRQRLLVWSHATLFPAKPSEVVAAGVDAISHACLLVRESDAPVPRWTEPRAPAPLANFRDGRNAALARLFAEMARRGTVLDATLWTYSADTAGSTTMPPLPAGSDNVAEWQDPWPDVFHELDALSAHAQLSNRDVLKAATLIGARAAGQERETGSVEVGKLANLVVFARDPLADLRNLRSVVMTVKRGRVYERAAFVPLVEGDITDR